MKNIVEYLTNSCNTFINESFQCSLLNTINNTINDKVKEQNEYNKKVKAEAEAEGDKYWSWKLHNDYKSFRTLIKDINIAWDKIKDNDFVEYSPDDAVIQLKRMASNRSTHFNGLAIPEYENDSRAPQYRNLLYTSYWGELRYVSLLSGFRHSYGNGTAIAPKDVYDYVSNAKKVYILNLSKTGLSTSKLKADRSKAKDGIVYNEKNYYERLANENKERYQKLAAQLKQKKYADDGISEKISSYMNKSLSFVQVFSKDPIKYASHEYDIKNIITLSGKLLSEYNDYMGYKLSNASGRGYSWEREGFDKKKASISKLCKDIDTSIEKLDDKLSAA